MPSEHSTLSKLMQLELFFLFVAGKNEVSYKVQQVSPKVAKPSNWYGDVLDSNLLLGNWWAD